MLRRFYTVMIVPHEGGTLRRLSLSLNFVVSMAGIFLFCFVSSAFLAQFFLGGVNRVGVDERLRVENERLDMENARLRSDLHRTVLKFDALDDRLDQLRDADPAWLAGHEAMGGALPVGIDFETEGGLAFDGNLRSNARAVQDKADFWLRLIEERICQQNAEVRALPRIWPVDGRITSGYQWRRDPFTGVRQFHEGIDIAAPYGTEVLVAADGVVTEARRHGGYGNMVLVDHQNGIETLYGHMKRIRVQVGQRVSRSDVVGTVGSSGRSTGPHLHFEIIEGGRSVDPLKHYDPLH